MRHFALLNAVLLLLDSVAAGSNVIVESLNSAPEGWQRVNEAHPSSIIRLRIALEQPNVTNGNFEKTLYEISSPDHPSYGQHLSQKELRDLVKPHQESTDAVVDWLKSAGVHSSNIENAEDWINFRTTVAKAEDLLAADFGVYRYAGTNEVKVRTLEYSVPEHLKSHITMVQPTTVFARTQRHVSHVHRVEEVKQSEEAFHNTDLAAINATSALKLCKYFTSPACVRLMYNMGNWTAAPSAGTSLGVSGFLSEYAKYDDLQTFLTRFSPFASNQTFTASLINGGLNDQTDITNDDVEANLDIQYAAALGYNTDLRFYSVGGRGPLNVDLDQPSNTSNSDEPYLELVTYLLNLTDAELPTTLSTSYGDNEREIPIVYAQKVCTMFGQLGARGVTVIFSSGDTGPGSACQTNDGLNTSRFTPIFPGACPYVTSVGGTTGVEPEQAVSFSSGGFSDYFPRPSYQDAAVASYLGGGALGDRWAGLYNATGRGFPDVSAQSDGFRIVDQGGLASVSGTSAAAPTFAGIISLVNNALVARDRAPLGFLNPWLYSVAAPQGGLTDITSGGSRGCGPLSQYSNLPTPEIVGAGWNATGGWDPVTGLGTPLFDKLLTLAFTNASTSATGKGSAGDDDDDDDDAYKYAKVGPGR